MLYAILGLSVLTWSLLLLTYLTHNQVVYGISLSYTAVQDLEIWLFAWSYYLGINSSTSTTTLSENKEKAWKLFNFFMWLITGVTTFFYCFFNYKSVVNS